MVPSDRCSVDSFLRRATFAGCFLIVYACVVTPLVTLVRLGHAVGLLSNTTD